MTVLKSSRRVGAAHHFNRTAAGAEARPTQFPCFTGGAKTQCAASKSSSGAATTIGVIKASRGTACCALTIIRNRGSVIRKLAGKKRQQGKNQESRRGQGQQSRQGIEGESGPESLGWLLPKPTDQGPEFLGTQQPDYQHHGQGQQDGQHGLQYMLHFHLSQELLVSFL